MFRENGSSSVWPSARELFCWLCHGAMQNLDEADRIRARISLAIAADSVLLDEGVVVDVGLVIMATREIAGASLASLHARYTLIRYIVMDVKQRLVQR